MAQEHPNWFSNRVFAVSGGGSGIGFALVKKLLVLGALVSVGDYRLSDTLAADLGGKDDNLLITKVDVTNSKQVETWHLDTVRKWGRLDGAANLAGTIPNDHNLGSVSTTSDDEWTRVMLVNVDGTKNCVREQVKYIGKGYLSEFETKRLDLGAGNPKAEGGSIVTTGSTLSVAGTPGTNVYTTSKHAVLGFTRAAAREFGKFGMRINCLCP